MAAILMIDDEQAILELVKNGLRKDGHFVTTYTSAAQVPIDKLNRYDLIILDIMMPDVDGFSYCDKIRSLVDCPILFLTAKTMEHDITFGLGLGADDYLTKPFSVDELLARLRVVQRRLALMQNNLSQEAVYENGQLRIDYASGCAYLADQELSLTPMEYKLLCLLAHNTGKVLTHKYILQNVWGSSLETDIGSLRVFMATLRKKLEPTEESPQYIQTHIGVGYRMIKVN